MSAQQAWDGMIDKATLALLERRKVPPFTGTRPVIVAVDLYDLVYDGGPRPVRELMADFPASCGEHAWRALPPTVELYAAARIRVCSFQKHANAHRLKIIQIGS